MHFLKKSPPATEKPPNRRWHIRASLRRIFRGKGKHSDPGAPDQSSITVASQHDVQSQPSKGPVPALTPARSTSVDRLASQKRIEERRKAAAELQEAERRREAERKRALKVAALMRTADMHERAGAPILPSFNRQLSHSTESMITHTMGKKTDHHLLTQAPELPAASLPNVASEVRTRTIAQEAANNVPKVPLSSSKAVPQLRSTKSSSSNWSKYERDTGMVDPAILRWD